MNKSNKSSSNEPIKFEESSCSNTSCCPPKGPVVRKSPKIGRNDPCICGNGRKYKKCCGKNI